eukprot:gene12849-27089_t
MDLLLSQFDITDKEQKDQIKYWYNGYKEKRYDGSSGSIEYIDKYNIWSIVQYLNNPGNGFISYWEESNGSHFIQPLFKNKIFKDKITKLVEGGGSIHFSLISDFSVDNFQTLKEIINLGSNQVITGDGFDVIFSYLFITEYLTIDDNQMFRLPNKDMRFILGEKLLRYYKTLSNIDDEILKKLTNVLQKILDAPQTTSSNKDRARFISDSFATKFHPVSKGRADLFISNKRTGIIVEVKYSKKEYSENSNSVQNALEQAKSYSNLVVNHEEKIFITLCVSGSGSELSETACLIGEIQIGGNCFNIPIAELSTKDDKYSEDWNPNPAATAATKLPK